MRMTYAVLTAPAVMTSEDVDSSTAIDILWAVARPEDLIEHIYVRGGTHRMILVFYHLAVDAPAGVEVVANLCRRARHTSPLLHRWNVTAICPEPLFDQR